MELKLDKDNGDVLLEGEYNLLAEERTRRSVEQFVDSDSSIFEKLDPATLEIGLLIISAAVVVLTSILFLFWLDHALTISAMDKFFKHKEKQNDIMGWYSFREVYSKETIIKFFGIRVNLMSLKIQLFKFSIFISFLIPPILFVLIASLNTSLEKYESIIQIINIGTFSIFTLILIFGLLVWTSSGKDIYFCKNK